MGAPLFDIVEPSVSPSPVVFEVPHASIFIPPPWLAQIAAPARAIAFDADLYVDELVGRVTEVGATTLIARVSRYVVDLNRGEESPSAAPPSSRRAGEPPHHGLIWSRTSAGQLLFQHPPSREDVELRLETIHRPYHRALQALLDRKRQQFGVAVLIAAHSMPSPRGGSADAVRTDVVPGTRKRTTAAERYIQLLEGHVQREGWSLRHDDPYAGGYSTQHYGRPQENIHAIQIEIARRLYLDEVTLRPNATGCERVSSFYERLARDLGALAMR